MKRYPKRAQRRWGPRRKFTGPPRRWTGLALNFGPGTEIASAAYWMAGDAIEMRLDSPGGSVAGLSRAIYESGPRMSEDGATVGSIGARALTTREKGAE